jgi:hypothetical protein
MKNKIVVKFGDEEWKWDFAILMGLMMQLHFRGNRIGDASSFVKSFQTKLKLWVL